MSKKKLRLPRKEKKLAKYGLKFKFTREHYDAYKKAKELFYSIKWSKL